MDFVVTRDAKAAYSAAQCVRHYKRCATPVTVDLEVYRSDVIASTLKTRNSVADSTAPENVVPRTLSHAPVLLTRMSRRLSVPLRFHTKS